MSRRLQQFWSACTPGARAVGLLALAITAAMLYAVLVYSAEHARARLKTGIAELHIKSAAMAQQASEIARLRATAKTTNPPGLDLLKTVQGIFDSNGLTAANAKISGRDDENVEVTLGNLPFAQWLATARNLQAQQIRIESCAVEGLQAPGMVSVTATLNRPRPR